MKILWIVLSILSGLVLTGSYGLAVYGIYLKDWKTRVNVKMCLITSLVALLVYITTMVFIQFS